MQSDKVVDWGTKEKFPIKTIAEEWRKNPKKVYDMARSEGLPVVEYMEAMTKPDEREMNDLTTAALAMWYLTGVDIDADGWGRSNRLVDIGDLTSQKFDYTPEGRLFWEIMDFDFIWAVVEGSKTKPELTQEVMRDKNPAYMPRDRAPMALGTLEAGMPWNDYQELMWMQKDVWGPSIDWMDIAGGVRTTNRKEIQKKYRDMEYDESQMLRTGEMVRHMIAEIGFSEEKIRMRGHGIQFRASYEYVSNPDVSVRDFRWEMERVGIALKIILFLQFVNFLIDNATVQGAGGASTTDPYGNLTNLTAEKWLQFRKMPQIKPYDCLLADPASITKWELMMMGNTGSSDRIGMTELISSLNNMRNSRQLNKGSRVPRYGWIDAIHSSELYNKFTDSDDSGLNNSGGNKFALMFNKSAASEIVFRRQSRQDEAGRDTQARVVYRDMHAEWGIHRPEQYLAGGTGTHRGRPTIIRTEIS